MQIICKISINNKTYVFVFNKAHFVAYVDKMKHQNSALKIVEIIRNEDLVLFSLFRLPIFRMH